jgi:hypothetical protein
MMQKLERCSRMVVKYVSLFKQCFYSHLQDLPLNIADVLKYHKTMLQGKELTYMFDQTMQKCT